MCNLYINIFFAEVVLYVPSVGIQQTKQFKCGIKSHTFIPAGDFTDVIINEDIGWVIINKK